MSVYELTIDVTEAVGLGISLQTSVTVIAPDEIPDRPVVCFGFPGGGYSRRYFTFDMPGSSGMGQAGFHSDRGWIFVACDHLACGDSTPVEDLTAIGWEHLVAANQATTVAVLERLRDGSVAKGLPAVADAYTIGIGQSMGAAILILQQGQLDTFDAVAVLGWSGHHAVSWMPPNTPRGRATYFPRGMPLGELTVALHTTAMPEMARDENGLPATAPGFHYDDVPREIVLADLVEYPTRRGVLPEWATDVVPPSAMTMMSPGAVAAEAAMITTPVLIGVGERDVCPDPRSEPKAYQQATDITLVLTPRMGHMHNFAGTRDVLWERLHAWGNSVATLPGDPQPA